MEGEEIKKVEKNKIGGLSYVNKDCFLVQSLGYPSTERCRYCELKFRHCLFFQYMLVSSFLVIFLLFLAYFVDGEVSKSLAISVFVLVLVYGYYLNTSTEKIIRSNFAQKIAAEGLRELSEKLKENDKVKSEFITIAAHQLRTPLTGINWALCSVMSDKEKNVSESIGCLEKTEDAVKNLISIVNDLLDVTKIEGSEFGYVMKENDIVGVVNEAFNSSLVLVENKKIDISFENKTSDIQKFIFDREKIIMALKNIIENAIDYTKEGKITVSLLNDEDKVTIMVVDTGIGIGEEDQKKLFTKFHRSKEACLIETDRSGLGLYITKQIVIRHKGDIIINSEKGKGTRVEIVLPYKRLVTDAKQSDKK